MFILFNVFFFRPGIGIGQSMLPTINTGDFIIMRNSFFGFNDPQRDDIVSFWVHSGFSFYMKRIVGLPGETVEIIDKQLFINGELHIVESVQFTDEQIRARNDKDCDCCHRIHTRDNYGPFRVPPGHYFVLGDNRDRTTDSRHLGFIPRRNIASTAQVILFSVGRNGIRWDRSFKNIKAG